MIPQGIIPIGDDIMRYEVRIEGNLAASFLKAGDALAFVAAVLRKQPRALPDIVDGEIGLPFDRSSVLARCKGTAVALEPGNSRGEVVVDDLMRTLPKRDAG